MAWKLHHRTLKNATDAIQTRDRTELLARCENKHERHLGVLFLFFKVVYPILKDGNMQAYEIPPQPPAMHTVVPCMDILQSV